MQSIDAVFAEWSISDAKLAETTARLETATAQLEAAKIEMRHQDAVIAELQNEITHLRKTL